MIAMTIQKKNKTKKIDTLEEVIEFALTKERKQSRSGSMSDNMYFKNCIRECLGLSPLYGDS